MTVLGLMSCRYAAADGLVLRDLRLTDASGSVTVRTLADPKHPIIVDEEIPLQEGDIVETGPRSSAELVIDGESVLSLRSGTRVKAAKLDSENTQFDVGQGLILAKVKPIASPTQKFMIKLPTAIVAIRGTEFGADTAYGLSHIAVFDEGHIRVSGVWGHEHVELTPNQETRVPLSSVPHVPYRLLHFQVHRRLMPTLRRRLIYWKKNWKVIPIVQRRYMRERFTDPHRKPLLQFRRAEPENAQPVRRRRKS